MNKKQKSQLIRIILASSFFVIGEIMNGYVTLGLFIFSYVLIGYPTILTAIRNISHGQVFDENFLMTIATIGALGLKQCDEAVAVMLFYQIGELFESFAVTKSRNSISDLMDIRPDYANLIVDGETKKVNPYDVNLDDIIIVMPGEKIPLDGTIIDGDASLDTAALTGESVPKDVSTGDEIISGCINLSGVLKIKVSNKFDQSTVSKILDLVENASSKKAHAEKFITRFAKWYTPIVVFSAVALALIPPLIIPGQEFNTWIYRGLLFLVISCPCALVISVPLSFFGGIGAASKAGILVKGSNYLEALAQIDTVIFDKTGTLTTGDFQVSSVNGPTDILELTALAEYYSNHPISLSIKKAWGKDLDSSRINNVEEISGKGIKANVDNHTIYAGNSRLMNYLDIKYSDSDKVATMVHVVVDNKYYGYISISDTIKKDSASTIAALKKKGVINTVMLTGDKASIAKIVSNNIGLDTFHSQLLPNDKVNITEKIIKNAKGKVVFVGDGINDAPVLARADVGIAMGGLGSQAAIEAADVVIMDDNLLKLPKIITIARHTLTIAKENVIFALFVKIFILILGAFGFANLWMAIFADVGVSVIAILNAMRTLKIK